MSSKSDSSVEQENIDIESFGNVEGGREIPITINDRRGGNGADGPDIEIGSESTGQPDHTGQPDRTGNPGAPTIELVAELSAKLRESDEKLTEAERQVRDFAERFRSSQAQLRAETDEQRARLQRNFEQRLETARGDLVAGRAGGALAPGAHHHFGGEVPLANLWLTLAQAAGVKRERFADSSEPLALR